MRRYNKNLENGEEEIIYFPVTIPINYLFLIFHPLLETESAF